MCVRLFCDDPTVVEIIMPNNKISVNSQRSPNDYFDAYSNLKVHHLMLMDRERNNAYHQAIVQNPKLFKDKIVVDVGAGTGILSLFAALAGAKHVYAVEASTNMIPILKKIISDNKYSEKITVVEGEAENLSTLTDLKSGSVDIIISEWMGFFLLHEGMLESVLSVRKFLAPNGLMFPNVCSIKGALCELPHFNEDYNAFFGLNMSYFSKNLRASCQSEPQIFSISKELLLSEPIELFSFNVKEVSVESLDSLSGEFVIPASRGGKYQAICLWFDVSFPSDSQNNNVLSTSPFVNETHWKQTVIVFNEEIHLEEKEPVAFEISLKKNGSRFYLIEYEPKDPTELRHPTPCNCYDLKCRVINAFILEQNMKETAPSEYIYDSPPRKLNEPEEDEDQPTEFEYDPDKYNSNVGV